MSFKTIEVKGHGQWKLPENRLCATFGKNVVILDSSTAGVLNGHALVDSLDTGITYSNPERTAERIIALLESNGASLVVTPSKI